ncbi:MAG: hypothetical protein O7G85_12885, partial [Planctomycetota bacterium]|nr:hypothetical protein [Planctomycetota bacterium]
SNRTKLRAWIRTQLQAGLSDSLFAQWDATYQAITARQENQVTHASGRAVQMLVSAPVSLSIRDLNRIEERLDLDDEARAQFEILQDSYRQSCETSAILKAEATKYYEGPLQPSLIQRQLQRDRNFFGTLQGLLDDDSQVHQIEWMSKIRERQLRSRNVYVSGAGNIDPITFLLDADLSLEMLHDLTPMIDDFNREASERFRARHESCLRFFRERPEPNHGELSDDALSALNRDIARFHEKAMQAFAARLPEVFGDSLLDTFHRAAHVMVFQDPNALHHVFQRPSLEDDRISPEQHRLILDLRAAYISRYGELTETMVQLVTANDAWIYGKHSGRPMIVPLRNHGVIEEYAPLRYARDELNASTNLKIRTILTPTQVDSIGGLPDLE